MSWYILVGVYRIRELYDIGKIGGVRSFMILLIIVRSLDFIWNIFGKLKKDVK